MSDLLKAAKNMDWQQVICNGGPPCFYLESDGKFCSRAKRWAGHGDLHDFISLEELLSKQSWQCAARPHGSNQTAGGNDPQECDWPICECDPYANKVLAALQEQGFELVKEKTFGR